tara:strand:- start:669 stop:857 length:189 start_codon:yes stop_codon:yes gene_type:complete
MKHYDVKVVKGNETTIYVRLTAEETSHVIARDGAAVKEVAYWNNEDEVTEEDYREIFAGEEA